MVIRQAPPGSRDLEMGLCSLQWLFATLFLVVLLYRIFIFPLKNGLPQGSYQQDPKNRLPTEGQWSSQNTPEGPSGCRWENWAIGLPGTGTASPAPLPLLVRQDCHLLCLYALHVTAGTQNREHLEPAAFFRTGCSVCRLDNPL